MHINRRLQSILRRRRPSIFDVIPRGSQSHLAKDSINPQPFPPHELGAAIADGIASLKRSNESIQA